MIAPRVTLHAIDVAEGERIADRRPGEGDRWAADFPFEGDVVGVRAFLRASAELGEQRPFGFYRISRAVDGLAIGGIGFKSRPVDGQVEVGYGLAPSARGCGYAAEALRALMAVAAEHGVMRVLADTEADNVASQRTLERAGFVRIGLRDGLHVYERALAQPAP